MIDPIVVVTLLWMPFSNFKEQRIKPDNYDRNFAFFIKYEHVLTTWTCNACGSKDLSVSLSLELFMISRVLPTTSQKCLKYSCRKLCHFISLLF